MKQRIPASVVNLMLTNGAVVTVETMKSKQEVVAILNEPDPEKYVMIPTINEGEKGHGQGNSREVLFSTLNEEARIRMKDVIFYSISDVKVPSGLLLPSKGLGVV